MNSYLEREPKLLLDLETEPNIKSIWNISGLLHIAQQEVTLFTKFIAELPDQMSSLDKQG